MESLKLIWKNFGGETDNTLDVKFYRISEIFCSFCIFKIYSIWYEKNAFIQFNFFDTYRGFYSAGVISIEII